MLSDLHSTCTSNRSQPACRSKLCNRRYQKVSANSSFVRISAPLESLIDTLLVPYDLILAVFNEVQYVLAAVLDIGCPFRRGLTDPGTRFLSRTRSKQQCCYRSQGQANHEFSGE